MMDVDPHTHTDACPRCPGRDRTPGRCDEQGYSGRWLAFLSVPRHFAAYEAAYLDGNPAAADEELARLRREYQTLPPRHLCSCVCVWEREGCASWFSPKHGARRHLCDGPRVPPCAECVRVRASLVQSAARVTIGRTRPAHAPLPSVEMLDLAAGYAWASVRTREAA